jgi:hypothetical protein
MSYFSVVLGDERSVEMGHMNVSCGGRSRPTMRCSRRAKTHAAERRRWADLELNHDG